MDDIDREILRGAMVRAIARWIADIEANKETVVNGLSQFTDIDPQEVDVIVILSEKTQIALHNLMRKVANCRIIEGEDNRESSQDMFGRLEDEKTE